MTQLTRLEWAILAVILVYSFIPAAGGLVRLVELAGGAALIPVNPRALASPGPIAAHILASFVFCVMGAVQFLPTLRRHQPALHRCMGRAVAVGGCISAATGLWMTHTYAFPAGLQGSLLYGVRMALGATMLGLITWAILAIRRRDVAAHRAAMLRAYAIGQGASTQTFLGLGWGLMAGTELLGTPRDAMMVLAWALNALIAERVIAHRAPRRAPGSAGRPQQRTMATSGAGAAAAS